MALRLYAAIPVQHNLTPPGAQVCHVRYSFARTSVALKHGKNHQSRRYGAHKEIHVTSAIFFSPKFLT